MAKTTIRPAETSGSGDSSYVTVAEVATRLRVSKRTVHGLCHKGELDYIRVGNVMRIIAQSVEDYEQAGRLRTSTAARAGAYLQGRA